MCAKRIKILMTCLSVCSLGVSCNEMIDTPMLLVVPLPNIVFLGDFNLPNMNWQNPNPNTDVYRTLLKAARWDHLNGILQTSLEEKNIKPFYRYIKAQKTITLVFPP